MEVKYIVYATGCTCYDSFGVSFPTRIYFTNFSGELSTLEDTINGIIGRDTCYWERKWSNQPETLIFSGVNKAKLALIKDYVACYPGLMIKEYIYW
jgi:hypothetical protein